MEGEEWHWGKHLRRIRLDKGFSQNTLAEASQIPQSLISQIERGTDGSGGRRNGSIKMALIFADVLRCTLDDLLGRFDEDRPVLVDFNKEEFDV